MELTQEPSIHRFEMIEDWRQSVVAQADLRVSLRTLETCECWSLSDGSLRHDSGRFFQVVGAVWQDESPQYCALIEQREIGTLASVIRHRNGAVELLVQAKVEPGNIDGVQFAPTAQATASNADCVHGGRLPPFSDYFARRKGRLIADSLQSEQGQKFLGKRNRNLMVCDDTLETTGPIHRWIPFRLFRALLLEDFRVNTDLRSVLCVTDWNFLSGGVPFSDPESLSVEFRDSFLSLQRAEYLQAVLRCLDRARQTAPTVTSLPVTSLPDWTFRTDHELVLASPKSAIKMIHVEVETREISVWDQPIFKTKSPQIVDLECRVVSGCLRFCFVAKWEPGLAQKVELGPTRHVNWTPDHAIAPSLLSVWQSDEGSRFFHDKTLYRVIRDRRDHMEQGEIWLSLSEVYILLRRGVFNNEARSVLSLILAKL